MVWKTFLKSMWRKWKGKIPETRLLFCHNLLTLIWSCGTLFCGTQKYISWMTLLCCFWINFETWKLQCHYKHCFCFVSACINHPNAFSFCVSRKKDSHARLLSELCLWNLSPLSPSVRPIACLWESWVLLLLPVLALESNSHVALPHMSSENNKNLMLFAIS